MVEKGADAVIAGCSELPLVLKQERMGFPLVDAIDILLSSAIRHCLGQEGSMRETAGCDGSNPIERSSREDNR